jgi:hypothetical protein
MFSKIYRKNKLTRVLATTLLTATVVFSVNFFVACAAGGSVSAIFLSEEKNSDIEPESEKESEPKWGNFYTDAYSTPALLSTSKDRLLLSSKNYGIYESYCAKINTPPPKFEGSIIRRFRGFAVV